METDNPFSPLYTEGLALLRKAHDAGYKGIFIFVTPEGDECPFRILSEVTDLDMLVNILGNITLQLDAGKLKDRVLIPNAGGKVQ